MTTGSSRALKIGEIADKTGMTVRTLRYYEEIGLIAPESRTDSGHRLYGPDAVTRLYKISLLGQLGLSLSSVQISLDADCAASGHAASDGTARTELHSLMAKHLEVVDARLATENRLRGRLVKLVGALESPEATSGDLLSVLEDMTMLETALERRIAILVYEDIEAAYDQLLHVFGFGPGELTRDPDGVAMHGEIQAGDGEFWLHAESEQFGLRSPNNLGGASGTMAVMVDDVDQHHRFAMVDDVDQHHRFAVERGATIRYDPVDQPYGYREYSAVDVGGHLWSFMKPLDQ